MSFSYYENEALYAAFVKRKLAYIETGICKSTREDWHSMTGDVSPNSPHSPFMCAVCGTRFIWAGGHPEKPVLEALGEHPSWLKRAKHYLARMRKLFQKRRYWDDLP